MADYFQQPQAEETNEEPSKIKVGEKDYSEEELSKLVQLGEFANKVQSEQDRSLETIYPKYVETTRELSEMKKKMGEFENFQKRVSGQDQESSPEALREQARIQLKQLGGVLDDEFDRKVEEKVMATLQARDLLSEIDKLNREAEETGKPKADVQKLLEHMDNEGFKSPTKAYKDLFEKELTDWQAKKLSEIKPEGFSTQEGSTAGAKAPAEEKPRDADQLKQSLKNYFSASRGSENT